MILPMAGHAVLTDDYKIVLATEMHWVHEESEELSTIGSSKSQSQVMLTLPVSDSKEEKKEKILKIVECPLCCPGSTKPIGHKGRHLNKLVSNVAKRGRGSPKKTGDQRKW